ncbi:hypothetical protein PoB_000347100 [Plakobranchus ocellatus]|uniref:Uncharacterized protein n=1 Tax=Plakobranchus ocellatus TaxID=259542 RepID=A0AAV3Y1L0_9GAST|nr:hypothetical protein PoB_000347100 [Plakobranchus ocellatus]
MSMRNGYEYSVAVERNTMKGPEALSWRTALVCKLDKELSSIYGVREVKLLSNRHSDDLMMLAKLPLSGLYGMSVAQWLAFRPEICRDPSVAGSSPDTGALA